MRKIFLLLMIIFAVSGCGNDNNAEPRIGAITQLNATPGQGINFFDNFNSMQMALASKNIDGIQIYGSVARYMSANNSDFEIKESQTVRLVDDFCCAMREDDTDLKNAFDAAIDSMKADGTLDALIDKYITDFAPEPQTIDMPDIDGAEKIKVGVTGDLPPLDLVLADGTPAGFNTAVLAEISKRIGKNIELVQVESGARAAALTSELVDVIFWVVVPADDSGRPKNLDTPEGISVTTPYYQDTVVNVTLGSLAAGMN